MILTRILTSDSLNGHLEQFIDGSFTISTGYNSFHPRGWNNLWHVFVKVENIFNPKFFCVVHKITNVIILV